MISERNYSNNSTITKVYELTQDGDYINLTSYQYAFTFSYLTSEINRLEKLIKIEKDRNLKKHIRTR
ncbi:hypothetical protein AVL50_17570 [Flammeovirga sp. SJP92]|nr:hypothetical protein AVL50_17570 [Flammeovirga sp. SJP92]